MPGQDSGPAVAHLTYGKFVTRHGGPVPFGKDYEITSKGAGLADWQAEAIRPSGLLADRRWSADLIDPASDGGCLFVVPVRYPGTVTEAGMAVARLRYRSEGGEGVAGRMYLQATSWFCKMQTWRDRGPDILRAAAGLRADPDVEGEPPRAADAGVIAPTAPQVRPAPPPDRDGDGGFRRIAGHLLDRIDPGAKPDGSRSTAALVVGVEYFPDEAVFLSAAAAGLAWLGELADRPFGLAIGFLGADDRLALRFAPMTKVSHRTPPPERTALDERRARLAAAHRPLRPLEDLDGAAARAAKDALLGGAGMRADDEYDLFDRRMRQKLRPAAAETRSYRGEAAGWMRCLEAYEPDPSPARAADLLRQFRTDLRSRAVRLDMYPDGDTGFRKLMLALGDGPVFLQCVPVRFIDWGLRLHRAARGRAAEAAEQHLRENLLSAFDRMAVFCPEEYQDIFTDDVFPELRAWFFHESTRSPGIRDMVAWSRELSEGVAGAAEAANLHGLLRQRWDKTRLAADDSRHAAGATSPTIEHQLGMILEAFDRLAAGLAKTRRPPSPTGRPRTSRPQGAAPPQGAGPRPAGPRFRGDSLR